MEQVRGIVEGLKDANIYINSELPYRSQQKTADVKNIADARLDLVSTKVEQGMKNEGVDIYGKITVEKIGNLEAHRDTRGYIKFRIEQKKKPQSKKEAALEKSDERKAQRAVASEKPNDKSDDKIYDNFVEQLTRKAEGREKPKAK
jgi:hypothetical protein